MASTLAVGAKALPNGAATPSTEEEEAFYSQLARLRDAVVAGQHPLFRLPVDTIEQLKAALAVPSVPTANIEQSNANGLVNGASFSAAVVTNSAHPAPTYPKNVFPGLPGLPPSNGPVVNGSGQPSSTKHHAVGGLDPIFLEKSDDLIRAEGRLKRARIEKELQVHVEQRKHALRDKDLAGDAPLSIDIEAILARAHADHVSGLRRENANGEDHSSFDENDYYSSQVQSQWSSPASSSRPAAGAIIADLGGLETSVANGPAQKTRAHGKHPVMSRDSHPQSSQPNFFTRVAEPIDAFEADDEDDEYIPPEAAAVASDGVRSHAHATQADDTPDDNSEYEPGEITQDSIMQPSFVHNESASQPSPHVPVIRNHLTHIAAPQPSRVSPLAVAKGPSIELELVNGRPEIVQRLPQSRHAVTSRLSSASPSANGAVGSGKKRRNKKRKRENEQPGRLSKKRDRHADKTRAQRAAAQSPRAETNRVPYIKDEPVSPPPFANVPDVPAYVPNVTHYMPIDADRGHPRHALQTQFSQEAPRSGLRYEYAPSPAHGSTNVMPSLDNAPIAYTLDPRRVASLHSALKPSALPQEMYSPAQPYRTVSMSYDGQRAARPSVVPIEANLRRYPEPATASYARRALSRSPHAEQEYQDLYAPRLQTPAPATPPRRIVVDQHGNRYYAAEPAQPSMLARGSIAPVERRLPLETGYDRAPSRMLMAHPHPQDQPQYDPVDPRMAPPPLRPSYQRQVVDGAPVQYINANGYSKREYTARPMERMQYVESPESPLPPRQAQYEQMPPPPAPQAREQTSPVYMPRAFSVRPEDAFPGPIARTARQSTIAPMQYPRQNVAPSPARAMSVIPGYEPSSLNTPHAAPVQQIRYVDQYGQAIDARDVSAIRQISGFRYQ